MKCLDISTGVYEHNLFKLEKNDPKCVYFYALANKCKGEKYDL